MPIDMNVAKRFLDRKEANIVVEPERIDSNKPAGQHGFDLSQSFRIAGIDRLIDPFSLGNYLSQLPRSEIENCQVFAVRVERIAEMDWYGKTCDFVQILADVAHALLQAIETPRLLMAYSGMGTFLCVVRGLDPVNALGLETAIQSKLAHSVPRTDVGGTIPTSIGIGAPIVPRAYPNQRVRKSFGRASQPVSARMAEKL